MFKRLATVAAATVVCLGLGVSADAAGPHQANKQFSLNTYYGVTANGWSGIPANGKSAYMQAHLLDKTDGYCSTLQGRAILSTPTGVTRGPAVNVVYNCSTLQWTWNNRSFAVASTSPNSIIGLEARICQSNQAGTPVGICTQYVPVNI